jgi:cysteine desulfurase
MIRRTMIYLDGFATTPLAPEARAAMLSAWAVPGNPGSPHAAGERAARIVADARAAVAELIGASPAEIVFTSGATEANNLAITGIARRMAAERPDRRRIVVSAIEHKAVLEPAHAMVAEGFEIVVAPVDRTGRLDLDALRELLNDRTLLVTIMAANNETGVLQPVEAVAALARGVGALVHCDAAQAVGKIPIDVVALDVDYASLSAHKLYGPLGVGALFVSALAPKPQPIQRGGGQEQDLRSGTEPAPLLAGFGAAAMLARRRLENDGSHGRRLTQHLRAELDKRQVRLDITTGDAPVLPGSLSIALLDVDANDVVDRLFNDICLSTGSACTLGQVSSSHVLAAMGYSEAIARHVLRVFCGRYNTMAEIDRAVDLIASAVRRSALAPGELRQ